MLTSPRFLITRSTKWLLIILAKAPVSPHCFLLFNLYSFYFPFFSSASFFFLLKGLPWLQRKLFAEHPAKRLYVFTDGKSHSASHTPAIIGFYKGRAVHLFIQATADGQALLSFVLFVSHTMFIQQIPK